MPISEALSRVQFWERVLDEVAERQDQPPPVPDLHDDIGGGDLLDIAPLALDQQRIVNADRLGDRQLDTGKQVLQHRLQRQTNDDTGDPGRRQQADAILLDGIEGHQAGGDRHHDDQEIGDPLDDA